MKLITSLAPLLLGGLFWVKNSATPPCQLPIEICDNGIDDDGDGLIDLNDTTDCKCPIPIPKSLIPNPSFEEKNCCPQNHSELNCAVNWVQASEPTTDFLNTCGWMGWPNLPPPLPFPDGDGCIGFRNGRLKGPSGTGGHGSIEEANSNWKEYAGACLTDPLKAGVTYRFEFWIGFTTAFNSPPTTIVFYGSTDCANLPFGIGDEAFGCPTNDPNWMELGSVPISGAFEWKQTQITVTPSQDIYAVVIGPNCEQKPIVAHTYYFFDDLVLAEEKEFEVRIAPTGNPCDNTFTLHVPYSDTLQYQWYLNGVALVGETSPNLQGISEQEGNYQVRLSGPNSCKTTPVFPYTIPVFETNIDTLICEYEPLLFDNGYLSHPGQYLANLKTWNGCDSTVHLKLRVAGESVDTVFAQILESESFDYAGKSFTKQGEYDEVLTSHTGCDSLIHIILDYYDLYFPNAISPNDDGINDVFTAFSGADVQEILNLQIYNRWGDKAFEVGHIKPSDVKTGWDGSQRGKPATQGVYVWKAILIFNDGKKREFMGNVTLLR